MANSYMADSKKNILIATGLFPPQVGGPATYSKLLRDKLPSRGFNVTVENFGALLSYPRGVRHLMYFCLLIYRGWNQDVMYAQDPISVGLPAMLTSKILRKKFYLKVVGDYAWEQSVQRYEVKDLLDDFSVNKKRYALPVRILKYLEYLVAKKADRVVVPSQYLKRIVSNWGINPDKIVVIYNAFDAQSVPFVEGIEKQDRKEKKIVSAGRLVPWKGFDELIKLMPEISEKIKGAHLYIAGDGPDRARLEAVIRTSGTEQFVTLLGKLDHHKLFNLISDADLFVLNTAYEGLSHQLLEVMALGTPIVATDIGGNPEVLSHGESGMLVPLGDRELLKERILEVLGDKELALKLVYNAKNRLHKFDEGIMLDEISEFLSA
jgi:glycosyltransferase involved in cell wall biosynthesis